MNAPAWWRRPLARALLLWALSALLLAIGAGPKRFSWSENAHFAHLARDLHAGRWTHAGPPPGFCDAQRRANHACRDHHFDDWAQAHRLHLDPSLAERLQLPEQTWAAPCATQACRASPEIGQNRWWIAGRGLLDLPADQYEQVAKPWFISFPPGPALWFLIPLSLGLPMIPDIPLTWVLAATIPATLDLILRRRWRDSSNWPTCLALAALFATPLWSIAIQGQVWFCAQISFLALVCGGFAFLIQERAGLRVVGGALWGWALCCRPSAALGLLLAMAWCLTATRAQDQRAPRQLLKTFAPAIGPLLAVASMAYWNHARFGSVWEFGHHFLVIRWQDRIQRHGLFSFEYIWRNLKAFTWQLPRLRIPPKISIHGLGWLWTTPWIFPLLAQRKTQKNLLLAGLLVLVPALLYQNTGQLQTSYRFAVDTLPFLILAIPAGSSKRQRWLIPALIYASIVNGTLALAWVHDPTALFVLDPPGWPF